MADTPITKIGLVEEGCPVKKANECQNHMWAGYDMPLEIAVHEIACKSQPAGTPRMHLGHAIPTAELLALGLREIASSPELKTGESQFLAAVASALDGRNKKWKLKLERPKRGRFKEKQPLPLSRAILIERYLSFLCHKGLVKKQAIARAAERLGMSRTALYEAQKKARKLYDLAWD